MPNRIKQDYGFRELLNSDDPGIRNYMVRNISFMISFCNKRGIINEQVVFLKKLLNEVSREEKNANFAHKVEDLPDDRWLGGYDPEANDMTLFEDEVEGYRPTLEYGYVFPPHKEEAPSQKRPKEDPLVLAKRLFGNFLREKIETFNGTGCIEDLEFKREDLTQYAGQKRDPDYSSYQEKDLAPNGLLYTKFSSLVVNEVKKGRLRQIPSGNKYTYLINKPSEAIEI